MKSARKYFENERWEKTERCCPHCGSTKTVEVKNKKPAPCRRKDCRKHFSVRTKSVLTKSNIPLNKCLLAVFLINTNLERVSSYKLARDIEVTQKTVWLPVYRICKIYEDQAEARRDSPIESRRELHRWEVCTLQRSLAW